MDNIDKLGFSFTLFLAIIAFLIYFGALILSVLDEISISIIDRPLFVHLYLFPKKITEEEQFILRQNFYFYNKLSERRKKYFHHRLAVFYQAYKFLPRKDFKIDKEVEVLIGGTYVMLTFGMRNYIVDVFDKILVYPDEYSSTLTDEFHKGEFNPGLKAVVFSWKDFYEGHKIGDNNLNLGLHEFGHVIHYHSLRSNDASALSFKKHYETIMREVTYPPNKERLINSGYFRIYAYTNQFEFISVIIEHYFETPHQFKYEFPELYTHVSKLLNHKH